MCGRDENKSDKRQPEANYIIFEKPKNQNVEHESPFIRNQTIQQLLFYFISFFFFNLKAQLRAFLTNLLGQLRYRLKTKVEIC